MSVNTIDTIITKLEHIVQTAEQTGDKLGLFAQMYLGVTRQVKEGIQKNRFLDGEWMERLDVVFANRYLHAFEAFQKKQSLTKSWKRAFEAAEKNDLLILQHLFMGMNAHINLDLGIAVAEVTTAEELDRVKKDFDEINTILVENIDRLQNQLNELSPLLFLLDWIGKRSDEHLMEFSLRQARTQAWGVANRLVKIKSSAQRKKQIKALDHYVALLNKFIAAPGFLGSILINLIKFFEEKNAAVIIKGLRSGSDFS